MFYPLDFWPVCSVENNQCSGMAARTAFGKEGKIRDIVASEVPVARDIEKMLEKAGEVIS